MARHTESTPTPEAITPEAGDALDVTPEAITPDPEAITPTPGDPNADPVTGAGSGENTPDAPTPNAGDAFAEAWNAAMATRHPETGDVPAVSIDAVKAAYRATPAASRGAIVARLNADTSAAAMATAGAPDVGALLASAKLSGAIAEAAEAGASTPKRDPRDVIAERVALLDVTRAAIVAAIDPADVERVMGASYAFATTTPAGDALDAIVSRLARIDRALGTGSGVRATTGDPRTPVAPAVIAAFTSGALNAGETYTVGAVAKAADKRAGAVSNAIGRGAIVGLTIVTRTESGAPQSVSVADVSALAEAAEAGDVTPDAGDAGDVTP